MFSFPSCSKTATQFHVSYIHICWMMLFSVDASGRFHDFAQPVDVRLQSINMTNGMELIVLSHGVVCMLGGIAFGVIAKLDCGSFNLYRLLSK